MKKVFLSVALFLLGLFYLGCCSFKAAPNLKSGSFVPDFYKRAVMLTAETVGGTTVYTASGFAIDGEKILTAGHFCLAVYEEQVTGRFKDEISIHYVNNNNEVAVIEGALIDAMDESKDLCVLKRQRHGIVPLVVMNPYRLQIHERVIVAGAPLGFFPYTAEGVVVNPRSEDASEVDLNDRLIISAPATHGVSGGPVINDSGQVVGVVMAGFSFEHLVIIVHAETIVEFLNEEYE